MTGGLLAVVNERAAEQEGTGLVEHKRSGLGATSLVVDIAALIMAIFLLAIEAKKRSSSPWAIDVYSPAEVKLLLYAVATLFVGGGTIGLGICGLAR